MGVVCVCAYFVCMQVCEFALLECESKHAFLDLDNCMCTAE